MGDNICRVGLKGREGRQSVRAPSLKVPWNLKNRGYKHFRI